VYNGHILKDTMDRVICPGRIIRKKYLKFTSLIGLEILKNI
jgi:hypothetical protein